MCFVSRGTYKSCGHAIRQKDYQVHEDSTRLVIARKNILMRTEGTSYDNCNRIGSRECEQERKAPLRWEKLRTSYGDCNQCEFEKYQKDHLRITYRIEKFKENEMTELLKEARTRRKALHIERQGIRDMKRQRADDERRRIDEEAGMRERRFQNENRRPEPTLERVPFQPIAPGTQNIGQRAPRPYGWTPGPVRTTLGRGHGRESTQDHNANAHPETSVPSELPGISVLQDLGQRESRPCSWAPPPGRTDPGHSSDVEETRPTYRPYRSPFVEDEGEDADECQRPGQDSPDYVSNRSSSSEPSPACSSSTSAESQPNSISRPTLKRTVLERTLNHARRVRFDLEKNEERILPARDPVADAADSAARDAAYDAACAEVAAEVAAHTSGVFSSEADGTEIC